MKQLTMTLALAAGLMLGGAAYGQNTSSQNNQSSTNSTSSHTTQAVSRTPERVRTSRTDVLPADTQLVIRTNENISATQADVGKAYSAEVARTIEDQNGNVLAPKGAPVQLTIASVKNPTLGEYQAELALRSITINGHRYLVSANTVTQQGTGGLGKNKKTAEMVGGAGGAGAQVLTKGKQVKVPAESVLTFQLSQPIQLRR